MTGDEMARLFAPLTDGEKRMLSALLKKVLLGQEDVPATGT